MVIRTNEFHRVAVKLQHPTLAEWIPLDMSLTKFSFEYIKWFFPEYPMTWLSDEMEASYVCLDFSIFLPLSKVAYELPLCSLPQELNFEKEAENIHRVREYFKNVKNTPVIIPNGTTTSRNSYFSRGLNLHTRIKS